MFEVEIQAEFAACMIFLIFLNSILRSRQDTPSQSRCPVLRSVEMALWLPKLIRKSVIKNCFARTGIFVKKKKEKTFSIFLKTLCPEPTGAIVQPLFELEEGDDVIYFSCRLYFLLLKCHFEDSLFFDDLNGFFTELIFRIIRLSRRRRTTRLI